MLKIEEKLLHESTFLFDQSHQLKILLAASSRSFSKLFMFVLQSLPGSHGENEKEAGQPDAAASG